MKSRRIIQSLILLGLIALLLLPFLWRSLLQRTYQSHIVDMESTDMQPVAIVFGAAVFHNGRLSSVLRDRMDTAIDLYKMGRVEQLLVSGYFNSRGYSEPQAMADYAVQKGVPIDAIQIDSDGRRTYDTCFRAHQVFGVERAIVVTQAFHLPRALYTCERVGISALGVPADQRLYRAARWYELRETVAMMVAFWDTLLLREPS